MDKDFWKNKTVLITGNTGFKGSWLTLMLKSLGARIVGYSLPPPTAPSLFELAEIEKDMDMVYGDIRDKEHLNATFSQVRPQVVIHMAAQSLVRVSYSQPVETCEVNIMGTVNVLEAVRTTHEVGVAVFVTSDKCYENKETKRSYTEKDPMGGHDLYSCSKGCDELLISAYRRSFFAPKGLHQHQKAVASVRAGNVVGGGDWAQDRLVVDVVKALMANEQVILRNPGAVRPWQHVLDPLSGYLILAERLWEYGPEYASAWNFGPQQSDTRPVSWVADQLQNCWANGHSSSKVWKTLENDNSLHEAGLLFLDAGKANRELGWQPKLTIHDSLAWTVTWYKAYDQGAKMKDTTMRQIENHRQLTCPDAHTGSSHPLTPCLISSVP